MQKTKMVFTIGPASDNEDVLSKLMEAGMSAARLNFSHGTHEEHMKKIELVRTLGKKLGKHTAIIMDIRGPKIRTDSFKDGKAQLVNGSAFNIVCGEEILGDETRCSVSYAGLCNDVKPGGTLLVDDGLLEFRINKIEGNVISTTVVNGGTISDHKGVNVPNTSINLPAVTEKDEDDLKFGCNAGVDYVAASFIRKAADVMSVRKILEANDGSNIRIISKIETQEGVNNIDEILAFSDGIMVARGDMGVEIPIERVPIIQKSLIEKCNAAGKPVITATQMLDSMTTNPRPTRAEASDVANAIIDGTDAIMLSGESASGKYPVEAARTMSRIAVKTEQALVKSRTSSPSRKAKPATVANALAMTICRTCDELNCAAICAATESGYTARTISRCRPSSPVIAVTPYEQAARSLSLYYGVVPIVSKKCSCTDELIEDSLKRVKETGLAGSGEAVIFAAGTPVGTTGTTNTLKIEIMP